MTSWLKKQTALHPQAPALYWQNQSWSFELLLAEVTAYQNEYQKQFQNFPVTRVALFSENTPEMIFTILALWEMGLEIQFLNTRLTKSELAYQLADGQAEVLLSQPAGFLKMNHDKLLPIPMATDIKRIPLEETPAREPQAHYQPEQIASIMYTSGTTGFPKGVPQRFKNHFASAQATAQNMQVTADDCWLCPLPLYHISGLSILLRSLVLGNSLKLYPKFSPTELTTDIVNGRGTVASVVTKTLTDLLPLIPVEGFPKSFRYFLLGGGPVTTAVLQEAAVKKISVIQSYGMTETCSQVIALPPEEAFRKSGSAGKPLGDTQLKILSNGNDSAVGEILLKGASVVESYLANQASSSWDLQGWFHTGDLGYLDEEKYLFVVSRLSELIISGGENIYPAEIETLLLSNLQILEAAVVGQTDSRWGQVPVAYLKITPEFDGAALKKLIEKDLARFKRPAAFFVVSEIPKTGSGKPLKRIFLTEERVNYIEYQLEL
ncbi:o-succinylbenzoate--CoA ligase [Enterococcus sp. HY326]|uniref:o-succinylbenzoate--CoA ligase n=1 Tax=Enterococcus sp. HY326 TaxID=2971265 RepID=UPI00223FA815|nr:o-succinylbenzoate--CoA ligase [Enterococcus sp. HY326]